MSAERDALAAEVRALVEAGPDGDRAAFEPLSLRVFAYQYAANAPYRAFCDASGATPETVRGWSDVPAFPTDAFKRDLIASFPLDEAVMAQLTSGTTTANQRGRIFRDETGRELVFAANRVMTGAYLFPDLAASGRRTRILILAPSPEMAPSMGMAIGMEQTRTHFGAPDSEFLLRRSGIDVARLVACLREAERTGTPVTLIGATSAFVYFLRACARRRLRFRLPAGSRVCDGGGYRGRFGEMTRGDYHAACEERLGVPERMCVNTLGMAESGTNYFDSVIRDDVSGTSGAPRRKVAPPWARVVAVDPSDGRALEHGEPGLLVHWDLVNLPTVLAVRTDNLGHTIDDEGGFEIVGRARVVDGRLSDLPSERPAGPMGDKAVFRLLEAYVNFSIDFKMGRVRSGDRTVSVTEIRSAEEAARGPEGDADVVASCPVVVDDLVAGADDEDARERAEHALEVYRRDAEE